MLNKNNLEKIMNGKTPKKRSKSKMPSLGLMKIDKLGQGKSIRSILGNPPRIKKKQPMKRPKDIIGMNVKSSGNIFSRNKNKKQHIKSCKDIIGLNVNSMGNILGDKKSKSQKRYLKRNRGIKRFYDFDKDGVPNGMDCAWRDPTKHGIISKLRNYATGQGYKEDFDLEKEKDLERIKAMNRQREEQLMSSSKRVAEAEATRQQTQAEQEALITPIERGLKSSTEGGERVKQKLAEQLKIGLKNIDNISEKKIEQLRQQNPEFAKTISQKRRFATLAGRSEMELQSQRGVAEKLFQEEKQHIRDTTEIREEDRWKIKAGEKIGARLVKEKFEQAKAQDLKDRYGQKWARQLGGATKAGATKSAQVAEQAVTKLGEGTEIAARKAGEFAKEAVKRPAVAVKERFIEEGFERDGKLSLTKPLSKMTGYMFEKAETRAKFRGQEFQERLSRARQYLTPKELRSIERSTQDLKGGKGEPLPALMSQQEAEKIIIRKGEDARRKKLKAEAEEKRLEPIKRAQEKMLLLDAKRKQSASHLSEAQTSYELGRLGNSDQRIFGDLLGTKPMRGSSSLQYIGNANTNIKPQQSGSLMEFMSVKHTPGHEQRATESRIERYQNGEPTISDEADMAQYKLNEYMRAKMQRRNEDYQPKYNIAKPTQAKFDPNAPKFVYQQDVGSFTRKTQRVRADDELEVGQESRPSFKKRSTSQFPATKPMKGWKRVFVGRGKTVGRGRRKKTKKGLSKYYRKFVAAKVKPLGFTPFVSTYGPQAVQLQ